MDEEEEEERDKERGQGHGTLRLLILMSSVRLLCVSKPGSKVKMRKEKACHFFGFHTLFGMRPLF